MNGISREETPWANNVPYLLKGNKYAFKGDNSVKICLPSENGSTLKGVEPFSEGVRCAESKQEAAKVVSFQGGRYTTCIQLLKCTLV